MRPTRRALGVAAVALAAMGLAYASGARALNAIAAPALVALVAGAVQLAIADQPTVERTAPAPGFPGETRTVALTVEGGGLARIVDSYPDGVRGSVREQRASLPTTVTADVALDLRGVWELGPTEVVTTDVLGLFVRKRTVTDTTTLTVYPQVFALPADSPLSALLGATPVDRREAFDTVREYTPGDPLRDVHWAASAKRPSDDLVVTEFSGERADDDVHVAASAAPGYADEMATAAASVARLVRSTGRSVGVDCPAGSLPAGRGADHRRELLSLLARTGHGDPAGGREGADVHVHAGPEGVTATVDGRETVLAVPADGGDGREVVSG